MLKLLSKGWAFTVQKLTIRLTTEKENDQGSNSFYQLSVSCRLIHYNYSKNVNICFQMLSNLLIR